MKIEKEIKESMKAQRLEQLQKKYFSLELDRISLEAVEETDAALATIKRMEAVEKAYKTVRDAEVGD